MTEKLIYVALLREKSMNREPEEEEMAAANLRLNSLAVYRRIMHHKEELGVEVGEAIKTGETQFEMLDEGGPSNNLRGRFQLYKKLWI